MTPDRVAAIVAGAVLLAFLAWFFFGKRAAVPAAGKRRASDPDRTDFGPGHSQGEEVGSEVTIVVDGGYAPDSIVAAKGVPLRLVFDRRDTGPCTDEVVLPDFGIRRRLPTGEKTSISIVPEKTGDFSWSCGMNMLHGRIRVVA